MSHFIGSLNNAHWCQTSWPYHSLPCPAPARAGDMVGFSDRQLKVMTELLFHARDAVLLKCASLLC